MIRFGTELQCIVMVGSGRSRDGEREGEGREGMTEPLSFWGEGGRLQRDKNYLNHFISAKAQMNHVALHVFPNNH